MFMLITGTYIHIYVCVCSGVVVVVVQFFYPVLSPNNGGGRIYLIPTIVLTPNLHLERLLALLLLSQAFLLCYKTAISQVFFGLPLFLVPFTFRSNALLRKLFLSFLNTCPYQRTLLAFTS